MSHVVFFDLDGTLEDSKQDMAEAVNRVRSQFGIAQGNIDELKMNVNRGMLELYKTCFADFIESETASGCASNDVIERIRLAYEADYSAYVAVHTKLYPGIKEALEALSKKAKLVLITNKPEKISRLLLQKLGIDSHFTDVMGGDSCPENKPSPLPLQIAAKKHGFNPDIHKAFMVGDSVADVKAGKAFGASTLWCAWGYAASPLPEEPSFKVSHPSELPEIILPRLS